MKFSPIINAAEISTAFLIYFMYCIGSYFFSNIPFLIMDLLKKLKNVAINNMS